MVSLYTRRSWSIGRYPSQPCEPTSRWQTHVHHLLNAAFYLLCPISSPGSVNFSCSKSRHRINASIYRSIHLEHIDSCSDFRYYTLSAASMDHQKQKETALCEELIGRIQSVLDNRSREWQSYFPTARAIIVLINGLPSPLEILGVDLYMEALTTIQRLVYQDADNGAEMDVVLWCERHWTILLERSPDNYKALRGTLPSQLIYMKSSSLTIFLFDSRAWPRMAAEKSGNIGQNLS